MAADRVPSDRDAEAEAKLQEALGKVETAAQRHAALTAVSSRVGAAPQQRMLAQSESKEVDKELKDAKLMLREAQTLARG